MDGAIVICIARTPDLERDWQRPLGRAMPSRPIEYDRESVAHAEADAIMCACRLPAYVYRLHDDGREQRLWPIATPNPEIRLARGDIRPL